MKRFKLLIVEDDNDINQMVKELLTQNGYETDRAYSGTEALLYTNQNRYDCILLDLMLPGIDGKEVLENIREKSNVPVIALTAKDEIASKVEILKKGADDYITKPFNNEELLARIETNIRRSTNVREDKKEIITFKDIILNRTTYEVTVKGSKVILTKREYLILELLMSNPNKVFTKNNIFESIWNEEFLGEDNAINVHISNIRQKIAEVGAEEDYIKTVWGIGFKMNT